MLSKPPGYVDVVEQKAHILGKPSGYFDFRSFSRQMARCDYES